MEPMTNAQVKEARTAQAQSLIQIIGIDLDLRQRRVGGNIERYKLICGNSNELLGILHGTIDRENWAVDVEFVPDDTKFSLLNHRIKTRIERIYNSDERDDRISQFQGFLQEIKDVML